HRPTPHPAPPPFPYPTLFRSISAGLDYPGVGPEHAWLAESGRVRYESATDAEALAAFRDCAREEGIIPALETAHALALLASEGGDRKSTRLNSSHRTISYAVV